MAGRRNPGPAGLSRQPDHRGDVLDRKGPPGASHAQPGSVTDAGLTAEEQGLVLDLSQLVLDVVGVIEPTPFADGSNAAISLFRRDWLGAGISAVSMLPYLGDFAKIGKLPKYLRSVREAVALAREDSRFARRVEPLMRKLYTLLEDIPRGALPEKVRTAFHQIHAELGGFLHTGKAVEGPIATALKKLPAGLRDGFEGAMNIAREEKPRLLKTRPGPVAEDALVRELEEKGFVRVKTGTHPKAATPGAGGEDSDVWLRRVRADGKDSFEAIRVDRTAPPPRPAGPPPPTSGMTGAEGKPFRRSHHTLGETTGDPKAVGHGLTTDPADLADHLGRGGRKGEFSHWHHEQFEATPGNLADYLLKKTPKGTRVFDPVGVELDTRRLTKGGTLRPADVEALKRKLTGGGGP